jgi:UDP-glucose 4-epimerase
VNANHAVAPRKKSLLAINAASRVHYMNYSKKYKYLVTGGAGFIGSHLVDHLINNGHQVTVIDNESANSNEKFYWNEKASNHIIDICEYDDMAPLFSGIDFVFHLAAEARIQPSINNPLLSIKTNTIGTANVLQAARESRVKRIVYSSTSSAYGKNLPPNFENQEDDCLTPYSVSKVAGEKLCKMYYELFGLETVILRYFNVYGDRQPLQGEYAPVIGIFQRQKNEGSPLTIVGDGEQRRDFTHVSDVVKANILASHKELPKDVLGTVFNIGSSKNYSINEIAAAYSHPAINIEARPGEARTTLANTKKAQTHLDWHPSMSLLDYIKSNN